MKYKWSRRICINKYGLYRKGGKGLKKKVGGDLKVGHTSWLH